MNDPHQGQRVWVTGLPGTFTIVAVYSDRRTVDLEAIDTLKIEPNIAFEVVHPVGGDISQSRFR